MPAPNNKSKRTSRTPKKRISTAPAANSTKPINKKEDMPRPSHEQIAEKAYYLWEANGCKPGRDEEHWNEAEAQLLRERDND